MRFKLLVGDVNWKEYGGKFVSKKLKFSEELLHSYGNPTKNRNFWLVIEVTNLWEDEYDPRNGDDKYMVTVSIVIPSLVSKDKMKKVLRCCGVLNNKNVDELLVVELLHSYGYRAEVVVLFGNNIRKLLKGARDRADDVVRMFTFYMDQQQNLIGNDGWDVVSGNAGFGLPIITNKP